MIRKELSIEDIRDLKDNSQVYIVYKRSVTRTPVTLVM